MKLRLPSADPTFRHLGRITTHYPDYVCEMGDECPETPEWWLTAPGSYVCPMLVCQTHAELEAFYFGTPIPA